MKASGKATGYTALYNHCCENLKAYTHARAHAHTHYTYIHVYYIFNFRGLYVYYLKSLHL
jgi:hypothetical protein